MNWLNIEIRLMRSPEYIGSEPVERATWLNLLAYCAEQENGGRITGCAAWKDRQWQQTCGVTAEEVRIDSELWQWDGEDIVVWHYPGDKEAEVRAKREAGAKGGKNRAAKQVEKQDASTASSTASSSASSSASTERKGKERNGKSATRSTREAERSASDMDPEADETTTTTEHMLDLERRVQGLRDEWRMPLAYAEMQALRANARCLDGLSDDDWRCIRDYLHARIPEGVPAWQPRSRAKFLESVSDVYGYATEWRRKNASRAPAKPAGPPPKRATVDKALLAEVFGSSNTTP